MVAATRLRRPRRGTPTGPGPGGAFRAGGAPERAAVRSWRASPCRDRRAHACGWDVPFAPEVHRSCSSTGIRAPMTRKAASGDPGRPRRESSRSRESPWVRRLRLPPVRAEARNEGEIVSGAREIDRDEAPRTDRPDHRTDRPVHACAFGRRALHATRGRGMELSLHGHDGVVVTPPAPHVKRKKHRSVIFLVGDQSPFRSDIIAQASKNTLALSSVSAISRSGSLADTSPPPAK